MNVPHYALFQNCINGYDAPNRRTARAPAKKSFKRHLLNHWPKFKIISQNCSSWCTLPKFHKWFHFTDQSFSGEQPRAQGSSCLEERTCLGNFGRKISVNTGAWLVGFMLGTIRLCCILNSYAFMDNYRECSGSVVECLTRERGAAGSSLTGVTALWSLSKTH